VKRRKGQILEGIDSAEIESSRFVASNTLKIECKNGDVVYRLHQTNIVTYRKNGEVVLDSGGWKTPTTKERMNCFAPVTVYQDRFNWFISLRTGAVPFYDGMILLGKNGHGPWKVISGIREIDIKGQNKIKRQITDYVKLIDKVGRLPVPSLGDCFYCSMKEVETGVVLGDAVKNRGHLHLHLEEGYLHGSILVNAMREKGYQDFQISAHYQMNIRDAFKRAVRSYLTKRLIQTA